VPARLACPERGAFLALRRGMERKDEDSLSAEDGDSSQEQGAAAGGRERLIIEANGVVYECVSRSGKGSFGVVYKAITRGNGQVVAIKRVLQDPRYKNRELQIMKMVRHPNTVQLINSFYERTKSEVFLNLVLAYVPRNLYEVALAFAKRKEKMPMEHIRLYVYQLMRALGYVHALGVCHRDIKPQNLLIDPETHLLKLCDFGSAKMLVKGEPNVAYICSRYYRAPELIFGASDYTAAIDVWSAGCVMAELILGEPIFAGESGIDQLVEIIKILGTPTREEIRAMNKEYQDYKQFPSIKPHPWAKVFPPLTPPLALEALSRMLVYTPTTRVRALDTCSHAFFDELRRLHASPDRSWPGASLPLFSFLPEEIALAQRFGIAERLLPPNELAQLALAAQVGQGAAPISAPSSPMQLADSD